MFFTNTRCPATTIQQLKLKTLQVISLVGNLVLLMAPHFAFPLVSQHGYQVISNNYQVNPIPGLADGPHGQ